MNRNFTSGRPRSTPTLFFLNVSLLGHVPELLLELAKFLLVASLLATPRKSFIRTRFDLFTPSLQQTSSDPKALGHIRDGTARAQQTHCVFLELRSKSPSDSRGLLSHWSPRQASVGLYLGVHFSGEVQTLDSLIQLTVVQFGINLERLGDLGGAIRRHLSPIRWAAARIEMQGSEVLTVSAEIAVALAGFSGIVVALRQRGLEAWPAHEVQRLRNMLELSALSTLFAMLPFLPHYLGASNEQTWSFCSFALSAGLAALVVFTVRRTSPAVREKLNRNWFHAYISGTAVVIAVLLVNGIGLTRPPQLGMYLLGLGWTLFFAFSLFIRLVLGGAESSAVE
jgi:hypothetical protein